MSILALDIGDRRIGLAILRDGDGLSTPLPTLPNNRAFLNELVKLKGQHGISQIVVGMPYTLNGQIGEQATKVSALASRISKKINLPVVFEDERLTTQAASQHLRQTHDTVHDIDAMSAKFILDSWLSKNRPSI